MANALELLGAAESNEVVDKTLVVDLDSRVIIIPKSVTNIGVESDDDVLSLHFLMPRHYGDVDLSSFNIYVNYENAKGGGDVYDVKDPVVGDETIEFDWTVGRYAVTYKGNVEFSLCLKESVDGEVLREFNTTVATLAVLKGLETGEAVIQQHADILEQWKNDLFGTGDTVEQQIKDAGAEQLSAIGEAVGTYVTEHKEELIGPKGEAFKYEDFTPEQLEDLKGPKGDAFKYEDFTPEQLAALVGPKGDAFEYEDFTPEQLEDLKGPKGDAFEYEDFTPEQLEDLKGPKGDAGSGMKVLDYYNTEDDLRAAITNPEPGDAYGVGTAEPYDIYIYGKTSGWVNNGTLQGAKGDQGDAFTYEDFTPEQLEDLKGPKGDAFEYEDFTTEQLEDLKGPKGDAFTYEDFTPEQLEDLKGKTPIKGTDYWTEEDKSTIVSEVLAAIPVAEDKSV